jgi:hypothetical protein
MKKSRRTRGGEGNECIWHIGETARRKETSIMIKTEVDGYYYGSGEIRRGFIDWIDLAQDRN